MLPVLFTLTIPAAVAKAFAVGLAALLAGGRAWAYRRRLAKEKREVGFGAALWDDRWTLVGIAAVLALLWRSGILDRDLRLPLHSYGLMIAAAFIVAIALAQREARRQGQSPERIADLSFWILVSALVGSRLYFIAVNWNDYFGSGAFETTRLGRVPRILLVWEGGLVFYGGFIAAALTAWWYMRRHDMAFLPHADTLIPSVAVGHFLGRIGCFGAGCCWGRASDAHLPWLARFPPESLAYQTFAQRRNAAELLAPDRLTTMPVHATQLYESLGELAIFFVLVAWVRPRKTFHGQALAAWLMLYAILRTVVETYRGDLERGVVAGLGVGTWTSVAIFATGAALYALGRRWSLAARAGHPALSA